MDIKQKHFQWEEDLEQAAKAYKEKYGIPGKVWIPAQSKTYRNLYQTAVRHGTNVDDLIRSKGYERVYAGERGEEKEKEEIIKELRRVADHGNIVRIDSKSKLYKRIFNLARRKHCSVNDLIEEYGFVRHRWSRHLL